MSVKIFGIKNCDTMKKALNWLDTHGVAYDFIDYKKQGADEAVLKAAITEHGWENIINRKGTTWRALPDEVKTGMDAHNALNVALENPSIIKRPLLLFNGQYYPGFSSEQYSRLFS